MSIGPFGAPPAPVSYSQPLWGGPAIFDDVVSAAAVSGVRDAAEHLDCTRWHWIVVTIGNPTVQVGGQEIDPQSVVELLLSWSSSRVVSATLTEKVSMWASYHEQLAGSYTDPGAVSRLAIPVRGAFLTVQYRAWDKNGATITYGIDLPLLIEGTNRRPVWESVSDDYASLLSVPASTSIPTGTSYRLLPAYAGPALVDLSYQSTAAVAIDLYSQDPDQATYGSDRQLWRHGSGVVAASDPQPIVLPPRPCFVAFANTSGAAAAVVLNITADLRGAA